MTTTLRGQHAPQPQSADLSTTTPHVEYHRVLQHEDRRIGRGLLAIALLIGGLFALILALTALGGWLEELIHPGRADDDRFLTPITHAAGLIATALMIPWSMIIQRWLYSVPGATLSSLAGRFRFDVFGRALLVIAPAMLLVFAIDEHLNPVETTVWSREDVIGMLVVSLLLVPLQAAGEEYGFRGLIFRVAASWARGRWASLFLGLLVSSALFAVVHTAGDPWWNVFYMVVSVTTGVITWRTGGLEIAVVIHASINTLLFVLWIALNADLALSMDRSPGSLSAVLLILTSVVVLAATVIVWMRTRRPGPSMALQRAVGERRGRGLDSDATS